VPAAPAGAHYHFELVGCRCRDRQAGELGTVADVVAGGGGWLLVVEREDGGRLLLPFAERFLVAIDRAGGRIEWDLPEGLIEACASRS
jgi:16S rRNA processing protein RimM